MNFVQWLESLPRGTRYIVETVLIVLGTLVLVGLIALIAGWNSAVDISNGLFYAASLLFLAAVVLYFGSGSNRPSAEERARLRGKRTKENVDGVDAEETPQALAPTSETDEKDSTRRQVGSYATKFIIAGFIVFGLSVLVTGV